MRSWKWPGKLKIQIWIIVALVFIIWIIVQNPARWAEGEEMNRLRRFYETVPHGQTSGRVAYATSAGALFKSLPDGEWVEDTEFNAGEAILADPTLKDVYKEAILRGCAMAQGK